MIRGMNVSLVLVVEDGGQESLILMMGVTVQYDRVMKGKTVDLQVVVVGVGGWQAASSGRAVFPIPEESDQTHLGGARAGFRD